VIKIERPVTGDPQRGLISSGVVTAAGSVNHFIEQPSRRAQRDHLRSRSSTIAGGTTEIMKNILAERVLGMLR
jgi:alkylation response protein AidB-like acyl-CoA dehydrogenase